VTATCSTPGCPRPPSIKSTGECKACAKRRLYNANPNTRRKAVEYAVARNARLSAAKKAELARLQAYERGVEAWITSIETLGEPADQLYSADLRAAIEAHR
jgi:hypothetical protein